MARRIRGRSYQQNEEIDEEELDTQIIANDFASQRCCT